MVIEIETGRKKKKTKDSEFPWYSISLRNGEIRERKREKKVGGERGFNGLRIAACGRDEEHYLQ